MRTVVAVVCFASIALSCGLGYANPCPRESPSNRDHRTRRLLAALLPEAYVALEGGLNRDDGRTFDRPHLGRRSTQWQPERATRHTLEAGLLWRPVRLVRALVHRDDPGPSEPVSHETSADCAAPAHRRRIHRRRRRFRRKLEHQLEKPGANSSGGTKHGESP